MSLIGNVKMASIRISVSLLWMVGNNNLMYQKFLQTNSVRTLRLNCINIMQRFHHNA